MTKRKKVVFHLKELLEKKDLGQRETARLADIRHATLHHILHNRIERLPMTALDSLIEVLDIQDIREIMDIVEVDVPDMDEEAPTKKDT